MPTPTPMPTPKPMPMPMAAHELGEQPLGRTCMHAWGACSSMPCTYQLGEQPLGLDHVELRLVVARLALEQQLLLDEGGHAFEQRPRPRRQRILDGVDARGRVGE